MSNLMHTIKFLFIAIYAILIFSCAGNSVENNANSNDKLADSIASPKVLKKAPSLFSDTLIVASKTALFFKPDTNLYTLSSPLGQQFKKHGRKYAS